jgi:ferredoxin
MDHTQKNKEVNLVYNITIDRDKCEGCGDCVENCPASILEMVDGKADLTGDASECLGCETCVSACPSEAVTLEEV